MRLLVQIGIVFGVCLVGECVSLLLPIPLPGSVISMVLLFLFLLTGLIKPEHIEEKADFLLRNMAFFFIPAGVGLMEYLELLKNYWWQLLLICLITTILTFAATAYSVRWVIQLQKKWRERHDK